MKTRRNRIQICLLGALACLNPLRRAAAVKTQIYTLIVGLWLATLGLAWGADTPDPLVDPSPSALTNTLAQIAALQAEAHALSPTQKKIATPLLDALREFRGDAPRPYAPKVRSNHRLRPGGKILVDIRGIVSASLLAYLQAQGAIIQSSYPQYESIRAEIPMAAVEAIAAHADVKYIHPAVLGIANVGTATSEGNYAETVDLAKSHFGVTGAGVKVGLLSDSVRYGAISQVQGDLGGVTVLPGQDGIGTNDIGEGTAMLEIVHDLAPGAQLYFATSLGGDALMASNIIALADVGCGIIIDDYSYFDESPFHANQPISKAVQTVSDRGIIFFSSAANSGNFTHGTSGTWTGNFSTFGFDPTKGQLHNWGGTPYNQITRQGRAVTLFWSDPLGGATSDYDLFITDVNGNVLRQCINTQSGKDNHDVAGDPFEIVPAGTNSGEYVVVALASGTQRDIYVCTEHGQLAHGTSGNTRGHNSAPAANAFCVAATSAKGIGPGYEFAGGTNNPVENPSSDGFPRLFYEADGSAVTPNDLTVTGGRVLLKPDITAADGTIASTGTFPTNFTGFTPFYGTSAAAPHAGAIAALLKSYRPDLTPYQIRLAMMNTALDIESLGFDANSGAGIVMADAAMISVDNTPPVLAVTSPVNNSAINLLMNISGTASDIGSGLQNNQIHFTLYNNGNLWSGTYWTNTPVTDPSIDLTASVVSGAWTFTSVPTGSAQVQGTYWVNAFARDNAGNVTTPQPGVNSISFTIDTSPPNVAITFPPNGSTITNQPGGNWFQGTASDDPGNHLSLTLLIRRNSDNLYWTGSGWGSVSNGSISNSYNSGNQTWQSTGTLPVPGSSLGNGDYHFIAIAVDAAGNRQEVDSVVSVDFHPTYVFTAGSYNDINPANHNMNWDNFENWDVGSVPTSDARVIINGYSPNNTSLGSLKLYRLDLSGGTLTTDGMLITNLNVSGGTLLGGVITLPANGVFNWSGGTLTGSYNVPAGATVNLTGSADKTLSHATLVNNGTVIWNGGNIVASYGSAITNNATFVLQSSGFFYDNGIYYGSYPLPVFVNNGLLQKTNSNGVTTFAPDNGGWTFNQNGTIDVENGALSSQGQFNVDGGAIFAGPGETRVDGGTVVMNGTNTIQPGATVELAGGTWGGNNLFTGPGTFVWSGGTIGGTNTIGVGANLSISGAGAKTLTLGRLVSAGNAAWTGAGAINCSFGSVFENDGTFTVQNDSVFYNNNVFYGTSYPQPVFLNNGNWVKTNSPNTTFFHTDNGGVAFNNNGSVTVRSGNLALGGGGTSQNANFNIASGSEVDLTGGTHNFGSGLNFNGGLTRMMSGILNFNGTNVLTNSTVFEIAGGNVTGTNTFAGTGNFNWSGGTISARLGLQSNIVFNITGAGDKTLSLGTINSSGPGTWTGAGRVNASFGSSFENDGTFTVQNDSVFYNNNVFYGYGYPQPVFINNGSWTKTNSPNTTFFHTDNGGVAFNNNGSVTVRSGNLALGGGGTSANDSFTTATGSVIDFTNGAFYFSGNLALLGGGTERVSGASVTFNNGTNTMGGANTFAIASGVISGTNTVAGVGTVNWSGGTISGTISLQPNIALDITGDGPKTLTGKLASAGNGVWAGAGAINCSYGGLFENDGTFTVQNDSVFYNNNVFYGYGYPQPVFINNGSWTKTNSPNTTFFHTDNGGVAFNNNGSVTVRSGNLALGGGGVGNNGSFAGASGSHIDFLAGNFSLTGNLSFAGAGSTRVNGGTLTFGNSASTMVAGGTFEVLNGSAGGTNTFAGTGNFNWSGGTISGTISLQPNIALDIIGDGLKTLTGKLASAGNGVWTGAGAINFSYGGLFENDGTFTVQNDSVFYNNNGFYGYGYSQPVFVNTGTFRKTGGTNATVFANANGGVNFNNTGTVDLRSGTLGIDAGYTTSSANQLDISIGGLNAGTQFGNEDFTGAATFAGTLGISLTNGFTPTNGNSFVIAIYSSRTGQFSTMQFPTLPAGSQWQLAYNANALVLQVIQGVPSTAFQSSSLTNGNFQFTLAGQTGSMCLIEASTNLFNWGPLLTNTPFNGSLNFVDPQTAQFPIRFYRATIFP